MDDLFLDNVGAENTGSEAENMRPDADSGAENTLPDAASRAEGGMTRRERHAKPQKWQSYDDMLKQVMTQPTLFAANCLYLLAGAGLILMQLISEPLALLIAYIFPSISLEGLLLAVNSPYYILFLLVPAAVYAITHGAWESMRLSKLPKWKHVWRAILAAAVAVPLSSGISVLWYAVLQSFGLTIVEEGFHVPSTGMGLILMVLCLGVLPGVCEELSFRGLVLGAWEKRGTVRAMLVSSLMFASLHGSVAGFPAQFLLGGAIAVMAVGSGSIYTGMIFHGVYNSLLLIVQFFSQNFTTSTAEDLAAAELMNTDVVAALGGAFGLAVMVIEAALMGLAMFFILRGIWPRKEKIDLTYGDDDWERPEEREFESDDEPGVELIPRTRETMDWHDFLVLLSAIVTVIFMYGQDFLSMLGGGA